MNWRRKVRIAAYVSLITTAASLGVYSVRLSSTNGRLRENQNALLAECELAMLENCRYRTSDSLNAVKVSELRLTLAEYKRHRAQDLAEIKKLKVKQGELEKVINTQASTVQELTARLADTVTPAGDTLRCFDYKSKWTDVSGCVSDDTVNLSVISRDALRIVETVQRKRFLGFLWKTKKVKSRQVDVVSSNPTTVIVNVDVVNIER